MHSLTPYTSLSHLYIHNTQCAAPKMALPHTASINMGKKAAADCFVSRPLPRGRLLAETWKELHRDSCTQEERVVFKSTELSRHSPPKSEREREVHTTGEWPQRPKAVQQKQPSQSACLHHPSPSTCVSPALEMWSLDPEK